MATSPGVQSIKAKTAALKAGSFNAHPGPMKPTTPAGGLKQEVKVAATNPGPFGPQGNKGPRKPVTSDTLMNAAKRRLSGGKGKGRLKTRNRKMGLNK